jgi:serine/threonine protein phosphatase PrpC
VIPPIITIPQNNETPARRELAPGNVAFTYVYARSFDTQKANALGQDFIAYCYDHIRIAFAVCDGVSQSFYGDLAARFLGTHLVQWLWEQTPSDEVSFVSALNAALSSWTSEATSLVQAKAIRANLPEMQKVALERKRANGSESMFVAGLIDRTTGQAVLCWMGDMRLWLWDATGQAIELPDAALKTRERWSSRIGPKNGSAHGCVLSLNDIVRITAHSDGVGKFADTFAKLAQDQLDPMVAELAKTPTSDDVSVLDINLAFAPTHGPLRTLATPTLYIADASEPVVVWDSVPFGSRYRISIDDGTMPYSLDVYADTRTRRQSLFLPDAPEKSLSCRVQALNDYALPSEWSEPVTFLAEVEAEPVVAAVTPLPVKAERKRRKGKGPGRPRSCLVMTLSAFLLTLLLVVIWILAAVLNWNNSLLNAIGRM